MAALLAAGPGALASHRSAAALWGLDGIREGAIELSVLSGRRIRGAVVHRRASSDEPRAVLIERIPSTSIERTIIDLVAVVSEHRAGLVLDDALRRKVTTLEEIEDALKALGSRGRGGAPTLRKLLQMRDERDALAESRLESRFLKLLRTQSLPMPALQHRVLEGDRMIARLDFAYPERRIGIETDGYRWHGGRERWARDIRRENRLKLMGWTLFRFSWEDVAHRPEMVVRQVKAALTRVKALELSDPAALP